MSRLSRLAVWSHAQFASVLWPDQAIRLEHLIAVQQIAVGMLWIGQWVHGTGNATEEPKGILGD